jgi:hypothetical protein
MSTLLHTSQEEALLRQRLRPCQLEDLDKTGSFCVRGSNDRLYRILLGNFTNSHPQKFIVDMTGTSRGFWFVTDGEHSTPVPIHPIDDPWERALAAMLLLEGAAQVFEDTACRDRPYAIRPTDYNRRLYTESPVGS